MKHSAWITGLLLLLCMTSGQAGETFEAVVTDFASLKQAINDANQRSADTLTSIRIMGRIVWPPFGDDPAFIVQKNVSITGGTFGEDGGGTGLFLVESSGKLSVDGSEFVDITHGGIGPIIFANEGELTLINVVFTSVAGFGGHCRPICGPTQSAIIENGATGKLKLVGVRFADSGSRMGAGSPDLTNGILANEGTAEVIRTQVYLGDNQWEEPLVNSGFLRLQNSSFMVRNDPNIPSLSLLVSLPGARTESVNSVFEGFTGTWCAQVESLGHNATSSPECAWTSSADTVGAPTGLIWRRGGDGFNLVPSAVSAIVDSADENSCADTGEIFDGNGDGVAGCDRGAYELPPTSLAEGGINGFYFDPGQDGHYVYVLETDYTTLVVWNTFDRDGNQVWVYGTGELVNGRSVVAKTYINRTGGFTPGGLAAPVDDEIWGQLEVDMESCTRGHVAYRSELPEFGSGQFPIERLAYVKQLGCIDPK